MRFGISLIPFIDSCNSVGFFNLIDTITSWEPDCGVTS